LTHYEKIRNALRKMACLRTALAILLVMLVGFYSASHSFSADDFNDDQSDDVAAVDCLYLHTEFRLTVPFRQPELTAFAPSWKSTAGFPAKFFSHPFLIPARDLLAQSGLMPRAPSLA
jgi:hypothetical protein